MVALVTSAGASNANSYCTAAEADTYHETVSSSLAATWTALDLTEKERLLIWSTRLIDQHWKFLGARASTEQALAWPRQYVPRDGNFDPSSTHLDETVIPEFLRNATAEMARILSSENTTADNDAVGITSIEVGSIALEMNGQIDITKGVFRTSVHDILAKYGSYYSGLSGNDGFGTASIVRA